MERFIVKNRFCQSLVLLLSVWGFYLVDFMHFRHYTLEYRAFNYFLLFGVSRILDEFIDAILLVCEDHFRYQPVSRQLYADTVLKVVRTSL